jgi:hypothetical protein
MLRLFPAAAVAAVLPAQAFAAPPNIVTRYEAHSMSLDTCWSQVRSIVRRQQWQAREHAEARQLALIGPENSVAIRCAPHVVFFVAAGPGNLSSFTAEAHAMFLDPLRQGSAVFSGPSRTAPAAGQPPARAAVVVDTNFVLGRWAFPNESCDRLFMDFRADGTVVVGGSIASRNSVPMHWSLDSGSLTWQLFHIVEGGRVSAPSHNEMIAGRTRLVRCR